MNRNAILFQGCIFVHSSVNHTSRWAKINGDCPLRPVAITLVQHTSRGGQKCHNVQGCLFFLSSVRRTTRGGQKCNELPGVSILSSVKHTSRAGQKCHKVPGVSIPSLISEAHL